MGGRFEDDSKDLLHKMVVRVGAGVWLREEFVSNSGVISLSRLAVCHGVSYLIVLII